MKTLLSQSSFEETSRKNKTPETILSLFETVRSDSAGGRPFVSCKAGCACGGGCPSCEAKSANLPMSHPADASEIEADLMADKVMRMQIAETKNVSRATNSARRKESPGNSNSSAPPIVRDVLNSSSGKSLEASTRSFMEARFNYDFGGVKIYDDASAAKSASSINALAYTFGDRIVFNSGQYDPNSDAGKRLLAHELAHVVQGGTKTIRRKVHQGRDHAGSYEFDDTACTFNYKQDWYFTFPSSMPSYSQEGYMKRAKKQVEGVWSHKHRLVPTSALCPCRDSGVDVAVTLEKFNEPRGNRHGYDVKIINNRPTADTYQHTRNIELSEAHDCPQDTGGDLMQQKIAHEFGHTLGITDEYHWWTRLWNSFGAGDPTSIMNAGDDVRSRHYQHFADLISNKIENCRYRPEGVSSRSLANPVTRWGATGGFSLNKANFILDLRVDRRLGNRDLFGLATPRLGFSGMLNASGGNLMFGPTFSVDLNRIAHPLYVDVGTGIFYDPKDLKRPRSLNIPASATIGFRGSGFSAGINYTGLIDILGNSGYTHLIGLRLQFDSFGER